MKQELIDKIKSRGYWRINFQPNSLQQLTLENCLDFVKDNKVSLRGWDYPHFPQRQAEDTDLESTQNYYQGWIDWWAHKEFWRMYKSGQFLHYIALQEDWYGEDGWYQELAKKIKPMTTLNIIGAVEYQVSEIFEFLSRLSNEGIYDDGVNVFISLHNIENRILRIDDERRAPFHSDKKTTAKEFLFQEKLSKKEIIADTKELSMKLCLQIFEIFQWHNPHLQSIESDIKDFLRRK